jgi:ABC-2 type transport system ATP-binding protein
LNAICVKNLKKYYGKTKAVDDISFEIAEGERFGFLGPNGAGKTTTIRSILGLLQITSGTVTILGNPINPLRDVKYRNEIGYLPGELGLPGERTGRQILEYFGRLYDHPLDWVRIERLATRLGLDLNRKIGELSKGNKQKVGVIASVMHPFKILILDEPTSGLDPLMQLEFFAILKEFQSQYGCTVLLSSHLLPEVESFCDRVAIIRRGKLVEISSIEDLQKKNLKEIEIEFAADAGVAAFKGWLSGYPEIIIKDTFHTSN